MEGWNSSPPWQGCSGRATIRTVQEGWAPANMSWCAKKWGRWLLLNPNYLTQVHACLNIVHMKPLWWKEVLTVLSFNWWFKKIEKIKQKNFAKQKTAATLDEVSAHEHSRFCGLQVARSLEPKSIKKTNKPRTTWVRKNHRSNSCQSRKRAKLEPPGKQNN